MSIVEGDPCAIDYEYDPLGRLTGARYSDGRYFRYTYDAAGNQLTSESRAGKTVNSYDAANRLASVDGVTQTWDANGNLLSDGTNTYAFDHANRLKTVTGLEDSVTYRYNALGDRLETRVNGITTTHYTLDLTAGLTQVLDDGTHTYLYGNGRIAQHGPSGGEYFLGDTLGSVRQLVDEAGSVLLAQSYTPYGETLSRSGTGETDFAFTGEAVDAYTGLVYLRARWYAPKQGRFITKDMWHGDDYRPISLNRWNYAGANPINSIDPSGRWYCQSDFAPLTEDCRSWVNDALLRLELSGRTGEKLVQFFHLRDGIMTILDGLVCQPLPILNGIKIYFEPNVTSFLHANAFAIWPDKIHINSSLPGYSGSSPSNEAIVSFGHEISHLAQNISGLSVQGEMLSTIVSYYLEDELKINHRNDGAFIIEDKKLDPWSLEDLKTYGDTYHIPWPLILSNGLSYSWLDQWEVMLPYPIKLPQQPIPVPMPPTPVPGTPVPTP